MSKKRKGGLEPNDYRMTGKPRIVIESHKPGQFTIVTGLKGYIDFCKAMEEEHKRWNG